MHNAARKDVLQPQQSHGCTIEDGDLDEVCRIASRSGAWVLADEIYRAADLDGRETPTLWWIPFRYDTATI